MEQLNYVFVNLAEKLTANISASLTTGLAEMANTLRRDGSRGSENVKRPRSSDFNRSTIGAEQFEMPRAVTDASPLKPTRSDKFSKAPLSNLLHWRRFLQQWVRYIGYFPELSRDPDLAFGFIYDRLGSAAEVQFNSFRRLYPDQEPIELLHTMIRYTTQTDEAEREYAELQAVKQLPNESGTSYLERHEAKAAAVRRVEELSIETELRMRQAGLNAKYTEKTRDTKTRVAELPPAARMITLTNRIREIAQDRRDKEQDYDTINKKKKGTVNVVGGGANNRQKKAHKDPKCDVHDGACGRPWFQCPEALAKANIRCARCQAVHKHLTKLCDAPAPVARADSTTSGSATVPRARPAQ